jgi:Icc-related predicted phosphoesterase
MNTQKVRLAAVADIHYAKASKDVLHTLFNEMAKAADVILLCGDLTDTGAAQEAHLLAADLIKTVHLPIVAVLGNHDFESGKQDEIRRILSDAGVTMLDGEITKIKGVGFAGIKGFGGGFGKFELQAWGEKVLKNFVHEAIDEELKLEAALARLEDVPRVVLTHYSPIRETVEGEPPDIFPFLGSSRLEEPIDRFGVSVVFHGHAHHGRPEGKTAKNIPVYNVSLPVLQKANPNRPPFCLVEIAVPNQEEVATQS